jgi:hypothetical protein
MLNNYEILDTGVIRQTNYTKINYDFSYSDKYNKYGEKVNYISHLRLGTLIGNINRIPTSILDVGYGNGSFLKVCSNIIPSCNGYDISNYPIPEHITRVTNITESFYDVITMFDSLEHMEDINIIGQLKCNYVMISVPWCTYESTEWFEKWHHRRPNEHLWHFSDKALITFFEKHNYTCTHTSNVEDIVRQNEKCKPVNILTCIFKKMIND